MANEENRNIDTDKSKATSAELIVTKNKSLVTSGVQLLNQRKYCKW